MAVNTLVMIEVFYLINSRHLLASAFELRHPRAIWIAIGLVLLLQLAFTYLPPMRFLFATAPLDGLDWLLAIAVGAVVFVAVEGEKALLRRWLGR